MKITYEYVDFIKTPEVHFPVIYDCYRITDHCRLGHIQKFDTQEGYYFFPSKPSVCDINVMMEIFYFIEQLKDKVLNSICEVVS